MMLTDAGLRRRAPGGVVFAGIIGALTIYLCLAAVQGEHGLFSLFRVEAQEHQLQSELAALRVERVRVANKASRLSTDGLDVELLDEQARKVLGLGRPDEMIVR